MPLQAIAIVVDSSVACSSGQLDAVDATSRACREAILALDAAGLAVVMTKEIQEEWKRHQSNFARRWLLGMYARKRVLRLSDTKNQDVRDGVEACDDFRAAEAMAKDVFLVEAALASNERIVSRDVRARNCFRALVSTVHILGRVHWVSPSEEACHPWLAQKAPKREALTLGGTSS